MDPIQNQMNQVVNAPSPRKPLGAIIGILIIVLVIILGGLYFWGQKVERSTQVLTPTNNSAQQSANTSDDLLSIEADLNNTNVNDLGSEMSSVETEIQSAQ